MKIFRKILPYAFIALALGLSFYWLNGVASYRVGDGGEYYALYYAWLDSLRPWMSAHSFIAYQNFIEHSQITGHVSSELLAQAFPSLRVGQTADFNHFWFYSLLAFVVSIPFRILGLPLDAHASFLVLHFALLLTLSFTVFRIYGLRGMVVLVLMTFLSPMLWYLNKIHTELFTYSFSLLAVALIFKNYYLAGSFFLAVASTQNPSFAIIAFVPFFYRLVFLRCNQYSFYEVFFAIGTALFVLIHPFYYFFRYGVFTPQLLAGGASLGGNFSSFYVWLLDPDLGLFPYWPLGLFFVLSGAVALGPNKIVPVIFLKKENIFLFVFVLIFFFVNFYAHSSTTNLNSGATRGPARYALWYLPIFFPLFIFVLSVFCRRSILVFVFGAAVIAGGLLNFFLSDPRKVEDYSTPSYLSYFIQKNFSVAYSPPEEVFAERYSGHGEAIHGLQPFAILGPDCKKILAYPNNQRGLITVPPGCHKDIVRLREIVQSISKDRLTSRPFYFRLAEDQHDYSETRITPGSYKLGSSGSGNFILTSGWSGLEDFGVWSEGPHARLSLPCTKNVYYSSHEQLSLSMLIAPFGVKEITIRHENDALYQGKISGEKLLKLELRPEKCNNSTIDIDIEINMLHSPLELGLSGDSRKLGIALLRFDLQ